MTFIEPFCLMFLGVCDILMMLNDKTDVYTQTRLMHEDKIKYNDKDLEGS